MSYWHFTEREMELHAAVRAGTHTLAYDPASQRLVLIPKARECAAEQTQAPTKRGVSEPLFHFWLGKDGGAA